MNVGNRPDADLLRSNYAALLDGAHQQLGGPIVAVRDNLNAHVSAPMAELIAAHEWLTRPDDPPSVIPVPAPSHQSADGSSSAG